MSPESLGTYYESLLATEVRKEGGIYYTPPLIVDYMVAESVRSVGILSIRTMETRVKIFCRLTCRKIILPFIGIFCTFLNCINRERMYASGDMPATTRIFMNALTKESHPSICVIVRMLKKSEDEDTSILERKIDALVYELYGLTQEEIAVIEKIG